MSLRFNREGYAAATISDEDVGDVSLVLDMVLDEDLLSKGLARDIIRRVQAKRKDLDLDVEATISLSVWIEGLDSVSYTHLTLPTILRV